MKKKVILLGLLAWLLCVQPLYGDAPHALSVPGDTTLAPPAGMQTGTDPEAMTDIIDIKPNETIGFDYRVVYIILGILAAVIVIGIFFFLIDRCLKRGKKQAVHTEPTVPADVMALGELDALERGGFSDPRIFYFCLTAILKTYLDGRFGLDAPEMTTEELLPKINELAIDKHMATGVKELLKRSDPVKFAGMTEKQERMAQDAAFVRSFVTQTMPEDVPSEPSVKTIDT